MNHHDLGIPLGIPQDLAAMLWLPLLGLTLACACALLLLILRDSAPGFRSAWMRRLRRPVSPPRIRPAVLR